MVEAIQSNQIFIDKIQIKNRNSHFRDVFLPNKSVIFQFKSNKKRGNKCINLF